MVYTICLPQHAFVIFLQTSISGKTKMVAVKNCILYGKSFVLGTYKQLDNCCAEFPTTHPYRNGVRGTRYIYLMASDRTDEPLPFRDVVKVLF